MSGDSSVIIYYELYFVGDGVGDTSRSIHLRRVFFESQNRTYPSTRPSMDRRSDFTRRVISESNFSIRSRCAPARSIDLSGQKDSDKSSIQRSRVRIVVPLAVSLLRRGCHRSYEYPLVAFVTRNAPIPAEIRASEAPRAPLTPHLEAFDHALSVLQSAALRRNSMQKVSRSRR